MAANSRAYAFCKLAEFGARAGEQMEAELDLERGLEILETTSTRPSLPLQLIIAETHHLLGHEKLANESMKQVVEAAVESAANDDSEHPLCLAIESQMRWCEKPDWELLLPYQQHVSVISTLLKVAGWLHRAGDDDGARQLGKLVEDVATSYSSGASIGSDNMRPMRSDIWAKVMAIRVRAATGNFQRSLELLEHVGRHHGGEAMRLVAQSRANEADNVLVKWIESIERPDLRAFAILGVLEKRLP